ncbi:MAG: DUF4373 domain-containing protein [Lachnospiraceae bacterium]|nr:DUF4373 domain-containing protein [Lachnospiraceae bacterium]
MAGRHPKEGVSYFSLDVDFLDDYDIMDLISDHGCEGVMIYLAVVAEVYKKGYYLEVELGKLATKIVRLLGNRVNKRLVLTVIHYCADAGLFHKELLNQGIITSAGIQRRYNQITARNKVNKEKYWLLDTPKKEDSEEALLKSSKNQESNTEKGISDSENAISDSEMKQNKRKENIHTHYGDFAHVELSEEEYSELISRYTETGARDRIAMLDRHMEQHKDYRSDNHFLTLTHGWVQKAVERDAQRDTQRKQSSEKQNSGKPKRSKPGAAFHDFYQRDYDYDELLRQINGG